MRKAIFIVSHKANNEQIRQLVEDYNVSEIIEMPEGLRAIWGNIPYSKGSLSKLLSPIKQWIDSRLESPDDLLIIQGEHGGTFHLVSTYFDRAECYHTTTQLEFVKYNGGSKRIFRHFMFRKYENGGAA